MIHAWAPGVNPFFSHSHIPPLFILSSLISRWVHFNYFVVFPPFSFYLRLFFLDFLFFFLNERFNHSICRCLSCTKSQWAVKCAVDGSFVTFILVCLLSVPVRFKWGLRRRLRTRACTHAHTDTLTHRQTGSELPRISGARGRPTQNCCL